MTLREEDDSAAERDLAQAVVDASFAIACPTLPVDHAWALSQAIHAVLPWFADEPGAALHTIHGAASSSGWMRPEGADAVLQLARRARLALRLPQARLGDAGALVGRTLMVAGWPLRVLDMAPRPLSRITTLYSRAVVLAAWDDEAAFVAAAAAELESLGIHAARLVCGRATAIATPAHTHHARSLMLAGITSHQSLVLQQHGIGAERKLGCGVFIAHKDIADLRSRSD
jgi:CRISPR-associated protein Cas6